MARTMTRVIVAIVAAAFAIVVGAYVLLVLGSRRGVEYYYGR